MRGGREVLMLVARSPRPRVLDLVRGRIRVEAGFEALEEIRDSERIAIVAHWSISSDLTRSLRTLIRELHDADYGVVVVSAAECPGPIEWPGGLPGRTVVLRKPNVGYDFGSWAVGLELLGHGRHAPNVLLANDSLVGPFATIGQLLHAFETSPADVWGLTDTRQFAHHLQSYFLGFRGGVLGDRALRAFFEGVRHEANKADVIHHNELGLSRLLRGESYVSLAQFSADDIVGVGENPTIKGWAQLLANGFPFVKREILTNPGVAPRSDRVPDVVRKVYGVEIADWLFPRNREGI